MPYNLSDDSRINKIVRKACDDLLINGGYIETVEQESFMDTTRLIVGIRIDGNTTVEVTREINNFNMSHV